jgi:hypothetical protein
LLFVVGIADDDVSFDFIEFAEVVDLRYKLLQREVFRRRCFRSLVFSIFVLFLGLFSSRLLFLSLLVASLSLLVLLDTPTRRLFLQINSYLIKDNREYIFCVENSTLRELFILSF